MTSRWSAPLPLPSIPWTSLPQMPTAPTRTRRSALLLISGSGTSVYESPPGAVEQQRIPADLPVEIIAVHLRDEGE